MNKRAKERARAQKSEGRATRERKRECTKNEKREQIAAKASQPKKCGKEQESEQKSVRKRACERERAKERERERERETHRERGRE